MGKLHHCLIVFGLFLCSTPAVAADSLCQKLRTFEKSEPNQVGKRSWFEFHWGNDDAPTALWSWGCRNSEDEISKATCDWLMTHTNQEFSMALPQAIMRCYGYRFPRYAFHDWARITGTVSLRGGGDRRLIMDLDYRNLPNGEAAVRVAREVLLQQYDPETLPPIEPLAPIVPTPRSVDDGHPAGQ